MESQNISQKYVLYVLNKAMNILYTTIVTLSESL